MNLSVGIREARLRIALTVVCVGLIQGCASSRISRPSPGGPASVELRFGPLSPEQQSLIDGNCLDGLPRDQRDAIGTTELVIRQGYVLEHSSADKIPVWVCEGVSSDQLQGHLTRSNRFKADPYLKGPKAYPKDYLGSGFDRGHQAPAGNQTVDPRLKDETFYMSNMAPQRPSLNRGIWKQLEDKTRTWVIRYGHAYEWTGPVRCQPSPPLHAQPPDACDRQTIGEHQVSVPAYFYKIVVVSDAGLWKAIAFLLPNSDFRRPYHLERYVTSIESIERATGIEFMPAMDAAARRALVTSVSPLWP